MENKLSKNPRKKFDISGIGIFLMVLQLGLDAFVYGESGFEWHGIANFIGSQFIFVIGLLVYIFGSLKNRKNKRKESLTENK